MLISDSPQERAIPDEVILSQWSEDKKRRWLSNEIKVFLEEYVSQQTSKKLDELAVEVNELDELERNGYPCRECGQKFKYHSTRVKYASHSIFLLSTFLFATFPQKNLFIG